MADNKRFVVVSLDFGGSSDVKMHYLGSNLAKAQIIYKTIEIESLKTADEKNFCKLLVDLLEVDDDFANVDGHTCFWPPCVDRKGVKIVKKGVKVLSTNNV